MLESVFSLSRSREKNGDAPGPLGDLSDRCWRNSEILFNFIREIPLKFNRNKKIDPEIRRARFLLRNTLKVNPNKKS